MFTKSFSFEKISKHLHYIGEDPFFEHVYAFRGKSGKRYIARVEQYQFFVFIIKFCLQERKIYADKYNRLTGLNECSRILATMGNIMRVIYSNNPFASFGFIGSPLPGEEKANTKRFKLYASVVGQLISPVKFEHRYYLRQSAYLMINRDNTEKDMLVSIETLFNRLYRIDEVRQESV